MNITSIISKIRSYSLSNTLIAINVIIFAIMYLVDPSISTKTAIAFGSKVKYMLSDGQYYRLLTANFVHLSPSHILFNSFALYIIGNQVEMILGKKKFILLYFVSGIISVMGSSIFHIYVSAGASGAIFGLMGVHLFFFFANKERYMRFFGIDFLILIGINVAYGFINPSIDNFGHLFGLLSGILFMIATTPRGRLSTGTIRATATLLLISVCIYFSVDVIKFKEKEDYYISKTVILVQMEKYDDAYNAILSGLEKFPSSEQLTEFKGYFNVN